MAQLRELNLRVNAGLIRVERYDGVDYTVVPVTALVEGVIRAINSPHPEWVSADRFSVAPSSWDGRPVFIGHPMSDGRPVSGNSPDVLKTAIGRIHNTRIDGKRLLMEAWLHPVKAKDIIARVSSNHPVEISTGAFVTLKDSAGSHGGKPWRGAWDTIMPDHLAILDAAQTGACSYEAGCGIRAAMYDENGNELRTLDKDEHGYGSNPKGGQSGSSLAKSDEGKAAEVAKTDGEHRKAASYHAKRSKELGSKRGGK